MARKEWWCLDRWRGQGLLAHGRISILLPWGIIPDKFFSAVAAVTGLSPDFKIDLVDPDTCREAVRTSIEEHGIVI